MTLTIPIRWIAALTAAAIVAIGAYSPHTASAHASIQLYGEHATPGGYGAIFMRVPHGCTGGLATDTVTVQIPAGFASVRPAKVAGWTESRTMTGSTVTAVSWTGGSLSNSAFMDFGISVKFPVTAGTYGFVTVQQCGSVTTTWSGADTPTLDVAARTQAVDLAASAHGHGSVRLRADASAVYSGDPATIRASVEGKVVKRWTVRLDSHGDLDRSLPTKGRNAAGATYDLTKGATIELLLEGTVVASTTVGSPSTAHGH